MKRLVVSGLLLLAPLTMAPALLIASCADSEESAPVQPDSSIVLEAAASEDADAGADGPITDAAACDGAAWCLVTTNVSPFFVLKAIWGTAKNDIWAAGSGGTITHYDGAAWTAVPSGVKNTFNAVWGSGPNDVYVVADVDAIFHAEGAAAPLKALPLGAVGAKVNTVWGSSAGDVRLGTDYVFFYDANGNGQSGVQFSLAKRDGGADAGDAGVVSWKAAPVDVAGDQADTVVRSIWGASASDLWISASQLSVAGREAITYHGKPEDGGIAFHEVDSQSSSVLESIHGTSPDDVWAVGSGGAIRHFTGASARWQVVASPTKETLHAVWAIDSHDVWAAGDHGTILHYDGTAFSVSTAELPTDRSPSLYGIWASGPDDVWIVGDAIALHHAGTKP